MTTLGILDAKEHSRIIADFDRVCTQAGVQGHFLQKSMTEYCKAVEVDWVRHFRKYRAEGNPGLLLEGVERPDTRCQSIAAALVRNYIDARVIPMNTLIDTIRDEGRAPSPSVLLIPNLFMMATGKPSSVAWRVQAVYDALLERSTQGKPTVAYVEDLDGVATAYGKPFQDFLSRFTMVTE